MANSEMSPWQPLPDGIQSLVEAFQMQDRWHARDQAAAPREFDLIERGLVLALDAYTRLHSGGAANARRAAPDDVQAAHNTCANLLFVAAGSLVSATRLLLSGAFVDAMALTRAAFEATFHAEYFRDHVPEAVEWSRLGQIHDLYEFRDRLQQFNDKVKIRQMIRQQHGGPRGSHDEEYVWLSTYGTHTNTKTVGLRMAVPGPERGNLGFVSVGLPERLTIGATHVLTAVAYAATEIRDCLRPYVQLEPSVLEAIDAFESDFQQYCQNVSGRSLDWNR